MDTLFRKSLLAGLIIGLGANAYLFCGRTIAGAAFFSIGIILIMMFLKQPIIFFLFIWQNKTMKIVLIVD